MAMAAVLPKTHAQGLFQSLWNESDYLIKIAAQEKNKVKILPILEDNIDEILL